MKLNLGRRAETREVFDTTCSASTHAVLGLSLTGLSVVLRRQGSYWDQLMEYLRGLR